MAGLQHIVEIQGLPIWSTLIYGENVVWDWLFFWMMMMFGSRMPSNHNFLLQALLICLISWFLWPEIYQFGIFSFWRSLWPNLSKWNYLRTACDYVLRWTRCYITVSTISHEETTEPAFPVPRTSSLPLHLSFTFCQPFHHLFLSCVFCLVFCALSIKITSPWKPSDE